MNKTIPIFLLSFLMIILACKHEHADNHESEHSSKHGDMDIQTGTHIGFVHNVYFWLNEEVDEQAIKKFENDLEALGKCKDIVKFHWGKPAQTPRDIVDNSYDYALNVFFENKEGHEAYQIDPIHDEFRENVDGLFSKIQIYDNLVLN